MLDEEVAAAMREVKIRGQARQIAPARSSDSVKQACATAST